jgi:hypothetical protein
VLILTGIEYHSKPPIDVDVHEDGNMVFDEGVDHN